MELATCLLDRYSLQQELSHKAGRRTFLAQDLHTQEPVAIKIIQFDRVFQWDALKLFEREAKVLKSLDHPAIPKYKDYFEADIEGVHSFVLVQTYIEAVSLEAAIQNGRSFSEAEVIEIAERLLPILSYLHENRPSIVHRDLKPSNILIANRSGNSVGNVYLVDFGSVQTVANQEGSTITVVGSYGYIPLEQFAGQAVPASDLYSLGMTLIYLATGVHPADLPQEKGKLQLEDDRISPPLVEWLARMTHPYVTERFSSANLALSALRDRHVNGGHFQHLKPKSSRVEIERGGDRLQITIRGKSKAASPWTGCLFVIPIWTAFFATAIAFLFFLAFLIESDPIYLGVSAALMAFPVSMWITFRFWMRLSNPGFVHEVISIDRNLGIRMGLYSTHSGVMQWKTTASRFQDIDFLAYYPSHTFHHYYEGTHTRQVGVIKVSSKLSIHAGSKEYAIDLTPLSHCDFLWIKKEISDFIGLEMQTISAKPKRKSYQNTRSR